MGFINKYLVVPALKAFKRTIDRLVPSYTATSPTYFEGSFRSLVTEGYKSNELIYAGLNEIITSFSEAPIAIKDMDGKYLSPNYPLLRVVRNPNPFMTEFEMWELTLLHLYLSGNAFWVKFRDNSKRIREIWPLRPDRMQVVMDEKNFISHYVYYLDGYSHRVPKEDIIHFRFPDPAHDIKGLSPIVAAVRSLATDNEITDHSKWILENRGEPSGVIELPKDVWADDQTVDRLNRQWRQNYGGQNRGRVAVLEEGASFKTISFDNKQMDLTNVSDSVTAKILMVLGVPPIVVGARLGIVNSAYADYSEARKSFWEETICPLQKRLAQKLAKDPELNPQGHRVFFDSREVEAFSKKRAATMADANSGFVGNLLTQNEGRIRIGLDPVEGGDVFAYQLTGQQSTPAQTPDKPVEDLDDQGRLPDEIGARGQIQQMMSEEDKASLQILVEKEMEVRKEQVSTFFEYSSGTDVAEMYPIWLSRMSCNFKQFPYKTVHSLLIEHPNATAQEIVQWIK